MSAGLGFGGGCLGKDIRAFIARANELGVADSVHFLEQVDEINVGRRARAVGIARDLVSGDFAGCNVVANAVRAARHDLTVQPAVPKGGTSVRTSIVGCINSAVDVEERYFSALDSDGPALPRGHLG